MRRGKWGGGNQKCRTAVLSRSYPGTGTVEEVDSGNKKHAWNQ
ncbi:MAG: hypothetical protein ACK53Y_14795 [bacterium]